MLHDKQQRRHPHHEKQLHQQRPHEKHHGQLHKNHRQRRPVERQYVQWIRVESCGPSKKWVLAVMIFWTCTVHLTTNRPWFTVTRTHAHTHPEENTNRTEFFLFFRIFFLRIFSPATISMRKLSFLWIFFWGYSLLTPLADTTTPCQRVFIVGMRWLFPRSYLLWITNVLS